MMKHLGTIALAALLSGTAATPACAQSLAQRIAAVRQKQIAQRQGSMTSLLQPLLYRTLTVSYQGQPAREVFEHLQTSLGVDMVVRYADDTAGHGIDPQAPITLEAEERPALEILERVVEQCSVVEPCTWQLRRGFIEVGTKLRLAAPAARELRAYPVDDLLYEAPDFDDAPPMEIDYETPYGGYGGYGGYGYPGYGGFARGPVYSGSTSGRPPGGAAVSGSIRVTPTPGAPGGGAGRADRARELIDLVIDSIEPNAWEQNGGDWATITYRDGALIVRAPDFIHRQIGGYPRVPPPAEEGTE